MTLWEWVTLGLMALSSIITYILSFANLRRRFLDHLEEDERKCRVFLGAVEDIKKDVRELRNYVMRRSS